jgi:hypothetical protein
MKIELNENAVTAIVALGFFGVLIALALSIH